MRVGSESGPETQIEKSVLVLGLAEPVKWPLEPAWIDPEWQSSDEESEVEVEEGKAALKSDSSNLSNKSESELTKGGFLFEKSLSCDKLATVESQESESPLVPPLSDSEEQPATGETGTVKLTNTTGALVPAPKESTKV